MANAAMIPAVVLASIVFELPDGEPAAILPTEFFSADMASDVLGMAIVPLAVLPVAAALRTVRTFDRFRTAHEDEAVPLSVDMPAGEVSTLGVCAPTFTIPVNDVAKITAKHRTYFLYSIRIRGDSG